jgi:hypothetical protein
MKDWSLHILDIAQNSLNAEATLIEILLTEDTDMDLLQLAIKDNGKGMREEQLHMLNDPFFSTGNKKTGLGIPLLKQQAETAGGNVQVHSQPGKGTTVTATCVHSHIDRQPLGEVAETIISLIRANPHIDFVYCHRLNKKEYTLDTRLIKEELKDMAINNKAIINFIKDMIQENLDALNE